jgi:acetylornithine deacetylase/succinyl-diaminopimelate desuccinylase-like protein
MSIARFLVFAASLACAAPAAAGDPTRAAADAWRASHEKQILAEFSDFVALPDVATTVPDVEKNAAHLQEMLRARGFATRLLRAAPGTPPTVYGEFDTPGAKRTVLYYAHYDGQPISQKGWLSAPFTPVMRAGALSGNPNIVDWRTAPTIR